MLSLGKGSILPHSTYEASAEVALTKQLHFESEVIWKSLKARLPLEVNLLPKGEATQEASLLYPKGEATQTLSYSSPKAGIFQPGIKAKVQP